jgi:uncharacterized protein with ParB-like and HNH nuclease domain
MIIRPEEKKIIEIFGIHINTLYRIPSFQRNYAWKPENIEALFNDVITEPSGYYLGNMLVTQFGGTNSIFREEFQVIDGQQRLTTIALFLIAIYHQLSTLLPSDNTDMTLAIGGIQSDIRRQLVYKPEDKKFSKMVLLKNDDLIFDSLIQSIYGNEIPSNYKKRTLYLRYSYIMNNLLVAQEEKFEYIRNFYEKLIQAKLLRISVDNYADAYQVFMSLNAKGVPLSLIDLLKSKFVGRCIYIGGRTEDEILSKWESLQKLYHNSNEEMNTTVITQFLHNNYDTFESSDLSSITKGSALSVYERILDQRNPFDYIETLIERSIFFSYINPNMISNTKHSIDKRIIETLDSLGKLDSSQSYPLLMFLLPKNINNPNVYTNEKVKDILEFLIAFFIRRNISLKPKSSNIRSKILSIVRLLNTKQDFDLSDIKVPLKSFSVDDTDFMRSLEGPVYDISLNTTRFILIRLERKNGNYFNIQTLDTLDDYKETKGEKKILRWTVEHILPQSENLSDDWKYMISPDSPEEANKLRDLHVHKLGNLTLTGYNSEMSDDIFTKKREAKDQGAYVGLRTPLFLNKSIINEKMGESFETKESWNFEDIDRRTKILIDEVIEEFKL